MWDYWAAKCSTTPAAHQAIIRNGGVRMLAKNPNLEGEALAAVRATKLDVEAACEHITAYPDAASGVWAMRQRSVRVGITWIRTAGAMLTDDVIDAALRRKDDDVDRLGISAAAVHGDAAATLITRATPKRAPKATLWMWAQPTCTTTDDEVGDALAEYAHWGSEYGHRYISAVLAARPGVLRHTARFTHPSVLTSVAGCRHIDTQSAAHVIAHGDAYAAMALMANPSIDVVEEVCAGPHGEEVAWMRAKSASRARTQGPWREASGDVLEWIVDRTASKMRTWDMDEVWSNANLTDTHRHTLLHAAANSDAEFSHLFTAAPKTGQESYTFEVPVYDTDVVTQTTLTEASRKYPATAVKVWDEAQLNENAWWWLLQNADMLNVTVGQARDTAWALTT